MRTVLEPENDVADDAPRLVNEEDGLVGAVPPLDLAAGHVLHYCEQ